MADWSSRWALDISLLPHANIESSRLEGLRFDSGKKEMQTPKFGPVSIICIYQQHKAKSGSLAFHDAKLAFPFPELLTYPISVPQALPIRPTLGIATDASVARILLLKETLLKRASAATTVQATVAAPSDAARSSSTIETQQRASTKSNIWVAPRTSVRDAFLSNKFLLFNGSRSMSRRGTMSRPYQPRFRVERLVYQPSECPSSLHRVRLARRIPRSAAQRTLI